jgi:hypothetical protein
MATWSASQDNSSYGNVKMRIWVGRGSCTRTATSVSFDFGVCFRPLSANTTNSIVAWYGGTKRFAYANPGYAYDKCTTKAKKGTDYYAHYSDRNSLKARTSESLCFSYSNSSINANTTSVDITIGVGWADWGGTNKGNLTFSLSIPKYVGAGTKPSGLDIGQTGGSNDVVFSGERGVNGTNNAITAGTLYYKVGSGDWQSEDLGTTSDGDYTKTKSKLMTSTNDGQTVSAYVTYTFENGDTLYNYSSSNPKTKTCYYYGTGTTPGAPSISQTAGDNTITISGGRGNSPSHNTVKSSTLYYKFAGASSYTSVALSTSSTTYTKTFEMDSGNDKKKLLAYVSTEYQYGGTKTGSETTSTNNCLYYDDVQPPNITITDHGNNTFTISATAGANGSNNTAKGLVSGSLKWGYAASSRNMKYSAGGEHPFTLEISGTGETRTVYAEATTDATYIQDIKGTANKAIKQYLAPTTPGTPTLDEATSLKNNRLTIKKNWRYTWTASSKQGKNGVAGYAVRVYKDGTPMTGLGYSGNTIIKNSSNKSDWVDIPSTNCYVSFNPVTLGFVPGHKVKIMIWGYSEDGTSSKTKKYSAEMVSDERTVQNSGVVRIKVGNSWKEGVVWIKTGGSWKEASVVYANVNGAWKEST